MRSSALFKSRYRLRFAGFLILMASLVLLPFGLSGLPSTTTTLSSVTPAAAVFGQPVTFTANVVPAVSAGSVAFMDGAALVGVGNVNAGVATAITLTLAPGLHSLRAVYGGGGGNAGSTSSALTYIVSVNSGAGFTAATPVGTDMAPQQVAIGDFNGDGKADLLVAEENNGVAAIWLGNGDGTFTPTFVLPAGTSPLAVAVGDFNGDGKADLAVANSSSSSNSVSIFLGKGDGTFTAGTPLPTGNEPESVVAADFNKDGKADLAVANWGAGTINIFLGKGDGTFTAGPDVGTGASPRSVAVGDFNGDGTPDLVTANQGSNNLTILLGLGDGTFVGKPSPSAGSTPAIVAIGDFNRDGKQDLAVANEDGNNVNILLGNGDGTFTAGTTIPTGSNALWVAAGDFNADGKLDLAVTNYVGNTVSILLGKGDGTFTAGTPLNTAAGPLSVVIGDFNGDGRQDLAVTARNDDKINIFLGTAPPSTSLSLLSSANPSAFGQAVTLTANITPSSASGVVEFLDGVSVIGVGTLNSGQAQMTTSLLASGPRSLRARYAGTPGSWSPSQSNVLSQAVNPVSAASFIAAASPAAGSFSVGITEADFNGDGKTDLAVVNHDSNNVSVFLGNGDGTFQPAVNYAAGSIPEAVATGDFNGDGKPDLVVANGGNNANATILLGKGDGTFTAAASPATGGCLQYVVTGDFNADGKVDVVTADYCDNKVSILLGNGDGTFQPPLSFATGATPVFVAVGDFNGDGQLDLVTANFAGGVGSATLLLGNGNGTFAAPVALPGIGTNPDSIAVTDFNGDGKADLAVGNGLSNTITILLGHGDGTFAQVPGTPGGFGTAYLSSGDFNGDGKPDLAVANYSGHNLTILLGNGDGTFTLSGSPQTGVGPDAIVVGDFNGDGRADLATSNADGSVSILLGQATPVLSITKSHTGNFTQGQQNAAYTISVSNASTAGPTSGTVTVTENLPSGLALSGMSGMGWNCSGNTCTRGDALPPGSSYPPITVGVNVGASAGSPLVNQASVSGGGSATANASDSTTIVGNPALSISKTHAGSFTQGQQGATYTITVSNAPGAGATSGTVTVAENAPSGLTLVSMSGTGWSCGGSSCTRADSLAGGSSYSPIIVTVNVLAHAGSPQVNQASVSGGGSATASANDSTVINSSGGGGCIFSLSSNSAHVISGAGGFMDSSATRIFEDVLTGTFTLNATNCSASDQWTAVSNNQPILALHQGAFGAGSVPVYSLSGNGASASITIGFAMFSNTTGHQRTAMITIAGLTFTLTQDSSPDSALLRIVRALYQTILGREPDSGGFGFWTGSGAPKDSSGVVLVNQMADGFYTSQEFGSGSWEVLSIYQAVQNKLPTLAQWLAAVTPLRPGTASSTAVEAFLDGLTGSVSNPAFVNTVIQNSWNRPPTSSELTQFVNQLNAGGATARVDFLNNTVFTNSLFRQNTNPLWITALYYTILVRDPDQAGFQFWVNSDTNPPGQAGIYYVTPSGPASVYAIKLATIGQAVPPNLDLLGFLGSPEFQSLIQGSTTPVNISGAYNRIGVYVDGSQFTNANSLDAAGDAYSGNLLSSPQTWDSTYGGATFSLGPANTQDVVSAAGQVIPLPAGQFSSLRMLATGVNGSQPAQVFKVSYSDGSSTTFTQSLSDWRTSQGFTGESNALNMAYRDVSTGAKDNHAVFIYGYSFGLNNAKTVTSVTLPTNSNVVVLGLTLAP